MGILILAASSVISMQMPHLGAFINMITVGFLIDFYMALRFMITPKSF
ncbi:MAG: hypothetical protein ACJ8MO_14030 [Bacillus sp. (in: firmicutes)]